MARREAGLTELRRDRAARFDLKAIHLAKKESRKVPEKASNHVMAQMQEEMMSEKTFDCACLLTHSTKPKHIAQATALFEGLISKGYRCADCRRHLGVLLLLEGRPRQAWALLRAAESDAPPDEGPCGGISYQDVLMWAYDQETEAREKAVKEYKERVKAGFNPKALAAAKAAHEGKDADKAHAHAYASALSRGGPEHQATALYVFEGLVVQGYRREACVSAMGLLYFMADRLEEAKLYLGEGLGLLKEEDPLKPIVASALDWTVETVLHLERIEPQRSPRREQKERDLVQERKKREEERIIIIKQEDKLRAEGKSYEEIVKILREREEAALAEKKAAEKAEQDRLAKERADNQAKQQAEAERVAKEKDMNDVNKAKALGVKMCVAARALWEASEAVRVAQDLEAKTEGSDDMKQNLTRLLADEQRVQAELEALSQELQPRLPRFTEVQKNQITGGHGAVLRALKALEGAQAAQLIAASAAARCETLMASLEMGRASWAAQSAERAASKAAEYAQTADQARLSAVAASVECAVALADFKAQMETGEETKRSPSTAKKSSIRKPRPEHWVNGGLQCMDNSCSKKFTQLTRRHHCRHCGGVFCNECCPKKDGKDRLCRNCVLLVKS